MEKVIINNSAYTVQRVFVGEKPITDVIQKRAHAAIPQILPLTKTTPVQYNKAGDCSVVRRHNG